MTDNTTPAALLIADISGYTAFVRLHAMSVSHAQEITARLLGALVRVARPPLQVAEIEGDAVFFYAPAGRRPLEETMEGVKFQILGLFRAFASELDAITAVRSCPCDACGAAGTLQLKQVLHAGTVGMQRIDRFEKPFGLDVILAHRILKNEVASKEYLLVTDTAYEVGDGFYGLEPEDHQEEFEGVGAVGLKVFYPSNFGDLPIAGEERPSASRLRATLWKLGMQLRTFLNRYR